MNSLADVDGGISKTWWRDAACHDHDPEEFFPSAKELKKIKAAKAICRGCPVRVECFWEAVDSASEGIFGGTTEVERRLIAAVVPRPTSLPVRIYIPVQSLQ